METCDTRRLSEISERLHREFSKNQAPQKYSA